MSSYARAMVGMMIGRQDIFMHVEQPGCHHPHDCKFCPECGAKKGKTVEVHRDFVHAVSDEGLVIGQYRIGCLDQSWGVPNRYIVLMYKPTSTGGVPDEDDRIRLDTFEADFKRFRATMQENSLWDPDKFGVWPYLSC